MLKPHHPGHRHYSGCEEHPEDREVVAVEEADKFFRSQNPACSRIIPKSIPITKAIIKLRLLLIMSGTRGPIGISSL